MLSLNTSSCVADSERICRQCLCSVIIISGKYPEKFKEYISQLDGIRFGDEYEFVVVDEGKFAVSDTERMKFVDGRGYFTQDQLFDVGVGNAGGKYVLLVREYFAFEPQALRESIDELQTSGQKISASTQGRFVLVDRSYYELLGGLKVLIGSQSQAGPSPQVSAQAPVIKKQPQIKASPRIETQPLVNKKSGKHTANDLNGNPVTVEAGEGTFIDPDVIIDCPQKVKIGANTVIRKGVVLRPEGGEIVIGDNCVLNHYTVIHGKGGVYIGNWTVVAPHCGIYAQNHSFERFDMPITKQPNIGRGVYLMGDNWLGAGAVVCDDVTMGKGVVIGANSTVTRSVPMAMVAAGSPAKVIRCRYNEQWDFLNRERASIDGMPADISAHVQKRIALVCGLVGESDSVLDVGCGEGIMSAELAKKAAKVVGCDYCQDTTTTAGRQYGDVEFVCCNSTHQSFPDESFTKVVLSDVAEHLMPIQLVKTLSEIRRVLKKDGQLILATPITGNGTKGTTYAHIYEYSENEMTELLSKMFCDVALLNHEFGLFTATKTG